LSAPLFVDGNTHKNRQCQSNKNAQRYVIGHDANGNADAKSNGYSYRYFHFCILLDFGIF